MGTPKALLPYDGVPFVQRLARLFERHCAPVVVVVHAGLLPAVQALGVAAVVNPDPDRGQLSSLQTGLAALPPGCSVLFTPVDCPAIEDDTISVLLQAAGAPIVRPRYQDRRGHPVLASPAVVAELLALPAGATAREVVHRHAASTVYVDVPDPGITHDIDHPEDYHRLTGGKVA
ncbi:MAG: nucleotidyltransferase family protein [Acidobacteria bacterium]|nr:nucleotidyltransferase family protein [Acidobacteriota bacterium]